MDKRQSESVCATLSQSHYSSLFNEVWNNGIKSAISNRTSGTSIEDTEKDIKAMQEIADRNGFKQ